MISTTTTNSSIGAVYSNFLISPIGKFWLFLIFLVPSTFCSIFVLYYLIADHNLRHSLNNHVIIVLLFTVLFCQLTMYPWMLYYFYYGANSWIRPPAFCLIWGFIDWPVYVLQMLLFAWASAERHILIFRYRWVLTTRGRLLIHYLPIVIIILYWFIFYSYVYFYPPCENAFNNSFMICVTICLFTSFTFRSLEMLFHYIVPSFSIIIFSITLILRVFWQKYRIHQPILWRRHRKMTIQLLCISGLYLIVTAPWATMIFLRICGLPSEIGADFENLSFFISYYIVLFFPFVAVLSLPELRAKIKSHLCLPKTQQSVVAPEQLNPTDGTNLQLPMRVQPNLSARN